MKALTLIHRDGTRHFLRLVPKDFDTQSWANLRRGSFCLLGVVKVEEREVELPAAN